MPPAAVHCAYVACAASIKRSSLGLALHLVYYVDEEIGGEGWEHGRTGGSSSTFCRNNREEVFIYCAATVATVAAAGDTKSCPEIFILIKLINMVQLCGARGADP